MGKWFFVFLLSLPLFAELQILAFAGSTREGSYNKTLIEQAAQIARKMGAKVTLIDLVDFSMPFYDADLEKKEGLPKNAKRLQDLMIQSDAVMIATPEYNSSLPALLKNVIDWTSRNGTSVSKSAYQGKKFAIMSASPGKLGGTRALAHLRAILEECGGAVVPKQVSVPQAYEPKSFEKAQRDLKAEIGELFTP